VDLDHLSKAEKALLDKRLFERALACPNPQDTVCFLALLRKLRLTRRDERARVITRREAVNDA
jgi:hypothetical protein